MTALIIFSVQIVLVVYCIRDIWKSIFKDRSAKMLWVALILALPVIGAVAYLQNRKNLKASRIWKRSNDDIVL